MIEKVKALREEIESAILSGADELEHFRLKYLSKKGLISQLFTEFKNVPPDQKREFGQQIELRCWDSLDARTATPTQLSFEVLTSLADEIILEVPGIVSVTYNIASKPPSTIEAV